MNKTYLFAYGTLRRNFELTTKADLKDDLVFIRTGRLKAVLYDLGDYPGAVKTGDGREVDGDVFQVVNEEKVFRILDEYEGEEYNRELVIVETKGEELQAWVYWYIGGIEEAKKIAEGNYLNYQKQKTAYDKWSITK